MHGYVIFAVFIPPLDFAFSLFYEKLSHMQNNILFMFDQAWAYICPAQADIFNRRGICILQMGWTWTRSKGLWANIGLNIDPVTKWQGHE